MQTSPTTRYSLARMRSPKSSPSSNTVKAGKLAKPRVATATLPTFTARKKVSQWAQSKSPLPTSSASCQLGRACSARCPEGAAQGQRAEQRAAEDDHQRPGEDEFAEDAGEAEHQRANVQAEQGRAGSEPGNTHVYLESLANGGALGGALRPGASHWAAACRSRPPRSSLS
jgi:hypothetical protein